MKADVSKIRFNPEKHYTAVVEQQGRVALDADANEQCAIDNYLRETETIDVVGQYGGPIHDPGFKITVNKNAIFIGAGRYYVAGLLCENSAALSYDDQPYLLNPPSSGTTLLEELIRAGSRATIRVFLEVWQRLATVLDDPCLREPALGQADTTARIQTVWRVVASVIEPLQSNVPPTIAATPPSDSATLAEASLSVVAASAAPDPVSSLSPCCQAMYRTRSAPHMGSLSAQTSGGTDDCGCQPIPSAGYRGLENQLYRVEIHKSGDATTATFKWSRENASVVVAIQGISGADVQVASLGPDANLGFQTGQWVEITDDTFIFGDPPNQPGTLYQIKRIDPASLTITMTAPVLPVDISRNARLRRWEQTGPTATSSGVALSTSWFDLENGIQIRFGAGSYFSGNYWTIPTRTASGQIEWPPCDSDGKPFQAPHYTKVHSAPLACIHLNQRFTALDARFPIDERFTIDDCRLLFPPLTDLTPPGLVNALHVTSINWPNDDVMVFDDLLKNGLTITFDQAPEGPVTPASFIVTLETPIVLSSDRSQLAASSNIFAAGFTANAPVSAPAASKDFIIILGTFTVMRSETVLDSLITASGNTLTWTIPYRPVSTLQSLEIFAIDVALLPGMAHKWPARVRIKLVGKSIFTGTGANQLFLDGETFGEAARRADGVTPCVNLQLPSGNGQKASDFDSWFYLYPVLQVQAVQVTYTALTVTEVNGVVEVIASTPAVTPPPTAQQATISLNYPAVQVTTLNLSLQGDSGVVTVPSSVQVNPGDITIPVTISLVGVPTGTQPAPFTLIASITNAIGQAPAQTAQFTITAHFL